MLIFVTYLCSKQCEKAQGVHVYTLPPIHPPSQQTAIQYYTIFLYSSPNLLIQQQPRYFCVYCSGICFLKLGLKSSTQGFTLKFEHHISFVLKMFELKTKSCRMNLLGWTHFPNTKQRTIMFTLLWFGKAKYETYKHFLPAIAT